MSKAIIKDPMESSRRSRLIDNWLLGLISLGIVVLVAFNVFFPKKKEAVVLSGPDSTVLHKDVHGMQPFDSTKDSSNWATGLDSSNWASSLGENRGTLVGEFSTSWGHPGNVSRICPVCRDTIKFHPSPCCSYTARLYVPSVVTKTVVKRVVDTIVDTVVIRDTLTVPIARGEICEIPHTIVSAEYAFRFFQRDMMRTFGDKTVFDGKYTADRSVSVSTDLGEFESDRYTITTRVGTYKKSICKICWYDIVYTVAYLGGDPKDDLSWTVISLTRDGREYGRFSGQVLL